MVHLHKTVISLISTSVTCHSCLCVCMWAHVTSILLANLKHTVHCHQPWTTVYIRYPKLAHLIAQSLDLWPVSPCYLNSRMSFRWSRLNKRKSNVMSSVGTHTCDCSTCEAEAGRLGDIGQHGVSGKTLPAPPKSMSPYSISRSNTAEIWVGPSVCLLGIL